MHDYRLVTRRLFCDWQMPDFLTEVDLDIEHFVNKMVEIGAMSIDFCSKSAFGNCLYPSNVGFSNKAIHGDGDIFGNMCKTAKSKGIEVFAYYNMLLDDAMGSVHSEWMQVDRHRKPLEFEHYKMFCMNSPYREHAFAHMREIASLYPLDGFNLDIQYFHASGCFCDWCKSKFKQRFGYDLDAESFSEMQNWIDLHAFQRDSRKEFIWNAMDKALEIRPDLLWYWNHSGFFNDDSILDSRATILATEVHPPDYMGSTVKAKWIQSSGKPIMFYMPESIGSWGHWSITTPGTLKGMCALALAHGGAVTCNHVAPPCGDYKGKVSPAVYELLADVMGWIKQREELCRGKQTVPVTAVLHSAENVALDEAFRLAGENGGSLIANKALGIQNSILAATVMVDSHVPVDFLYNEDSLDRLNEYEAIILPNAGYMTNKFAGKMREYVAAGGKVIATYNTSLLDSQANECGNFLLADLFGADFVKYSDYSLAYVDKFKDEFGNKIPKMPLLMKDADYQLNSLHKPIYCSLRAGAKSVATFTEPIIESDWETGYHIYHDHAPPGTCTDWPAVIINQYGKGMCAFLPFPFLQAYGMQPNPWYRQLILNILGYMGVPEKIRYEASPAIQMTATQDADGWLIHLMKIMKETTSMFLDEVTPSGPVSVTVRPPWRVGSVVNAITGEQVVFTGENGTTRFTISGVTNYEIIRICKL